MIFLINEWPAHCPKCGEERGTPRDVHARSDFFAGCSHSCKCGAKWQFVETATLVETTKATGGDLHQYVDR